MLLIFEMCAAYVYEVRGVLLIVLGLARFDWAKPVLSGPSNTLSVVWILCVDLAKNGKKKPPRKGAKSLSLFE